MNQKQKIKNAFNKMAHHYNDHCQLQYSIGEDLIALLPFQLFSSPSILDIGCGTGLVTRELAAQIPYSHFRAIDIADHALRHAKELLNNISLGTYDFDHPIPDHFDIIFSNMTLHWSPNLETTFKNIYQAIKPGGLFAFSIPLYETFHEIAPFCSINSFFYYDFIKKALQTDYHEIQSKTKKIVLHFDRLYDALHSIKKIGANFVTNRTQLYNKNLRQHLNRPTFLTYHIGYFIAKKSDI